ncbi:MAG: response regulator [Ignavibacteria bacterium]|nr:response regulator [Ignavibacteria bacterium]
MSDILKCVMLVDDDKNDNFFHEREIRKTNPETIIIVKTSGKEALDYLISQSYIIEPHPELIFLDINMPGMNGWEFLAEYNKMDKELQSRAIIIMLSTSKNPEDESRCKSWSFVSDYIKKPLTRGIMNDIVGKYF